VDATGLGGTTVLKHLKKLVAEGRVIEVGKKGRGSRKLYHRAEEMRTEGAAKQPRGGGAAVSPARTIGPLGTTMHPAAGSSYRRLGGRLGVYLVTRRRDPLRRHHHLRGRCLRRPSLWSRAPLY
jgi:hypothetical protein